MKSKMRDTMWWTGMDKDVQHFVEQCEGCRMNALADPPEPIISTKLPDTPWSYVAVDLMGPSPTGEHIFVMVDYFSRYFEVKIMNVTNAASINLAMEEIFSRLGYVSCMKADNGPPFNSKEFKDYLQNANIRLIHTVPYSPWQNGEVERVNRDIKRNILINHNTGIDWKEGLLKFLFMSRTTKHSSTGETAIKLLWGRQVKGKWPQIGEIPIEDGDWRDKDAECKRKAKLYADTKRHAKQSLIERGDEVLVKNTTKRSKWDPNFPQSATVLSKNGAELILKGDDSKHLKRNVIHAKKFSSTRVNDPLKNQPENIPIQLPSTECTADQTVAEQRGFIVQTKDTEKSDKGNPAFISSTPRPSRERKRPGHLQNFEMNLSQISDI